MRPVKLVISAFGPYRDKQEIDFRDFHNSIFLITGDTGSGKTTIFDAISYVLFGSASGKIRDNSSFRSDFAGVDDKTYVSLEFINKGITYKVERSPKYMRPKKRGDGFVTVSGDASLEYLDKVITGDKNVNLEINEILGLNYNQFKQISMIAQGEFLELLHAKTKDRAEIFRHIFDTNIYKLFSDKLKEKYLEIKREYDNNINILNSYKDSVTLDIDKELLVDKYLEELKDKLEEYNSNLIDVREQYDKYNDDKIKLVSVISEGNIILENRNNLRKYNNELDKLLLKKDYYNELEDKYKNIKIVREFIKPVIDNIDKLKKELSDNNNILDKLKKDYISIDNDYKDICIKYKELDNKRDEVNLFNKKIGNIKDNLIVLEDINRLKSTLENKYNIYNLLYLDDLRSILDKNDKYLELNIKIGKKQNKLKEKQAKYIQLNDKYVEEYNLFISNQAGIIASTLKEGMRCPVCGSIEHPHLAGLVDGVMSEGELKKLKDDVENLCLEINNDSIEINNIINVRDNIYNDIRDIDIEDVKDKINSININKDNSYKKYNINDIKEEITKLEVSIHEKETSINKDDIKELEKLEKDVENLNNYIKDINNRYEELFREINDYDNRIKLCNDKIDKLKIDIRDNEKKYNDLMIKYNYDSIDKYLISYEDEEKICKDINNYNNSIVSIRGNIEAIKLFLDNKSDIDIALKNEELENINSKLEKLSEDVENLNKVINLNSKLYNNINDLYNNNKDVICKLGIYKNLSDTANGNLVGKNKQEFEQYVQASYFDRILKYANKRLLLMTSDRYELYRKVDVSSISDKLGLEFEVMDYYTGKVRSINSLSGGESFKAALALSLGITDVISEYAGGVSVDTLFIDEGFGSLDSESLESALNAIMMSQGNKMIGIISHVTELHDIIDKKIIIKKESVGSSIEIKI